MFRFWQQRPAQPMARFCQRFRDRTVIVHRGLPANWLQELLKQPGGGGHFRLDSRPLPTTTPTPIEWLVQTHVLPLDLPQPLLLQVATQDIRLRHLCRGERVVHPSEIAWFLEELLSRYHFRLDLRDTTDTAAVVALPGIPLADNAALSMMESISG